MWLLLFTSLLAWADLPVKGNPYFPPAGTYQFKGDFELLQKRRFEVVYTFADSGRTRLRELKDQGYACNGATRDTFLCWAFQEKTGEHAGLAERLARSLADTSLEFGATRGEAQLIRKGDSNTEWSMPQAVSFRGRYYDSYRFLFGSGVSRIFLGEPGEVTLVVGAQGELGYSLELPVTESKTVYFRYFGLADFTKAP